MAAFHALCGAIIIFGFWHLCAAQQCSTLFTFNGSVLNFTKCVALSSQNAVLAWTFYEGNSTLTLAFAGTAPSISGWVGWGINPITASQMVGSSALVAFQSADNGSNVLPYKLTSQVQLLQVPLSCTPVDIVIRATSVEIQGGKGAIVRAFVETQTAAAAPATKKHSRKDEEGVIISTYKPKSPYIGKCLLNNKIVRDDAPGETWHMVFSTEGLVKYREGQSICVIPPGIDANGKPHKLRLYSIASSAPGDFGDYKTVSLCVKRLVYLNDKGEEVKGVCSNFLCKILFTKFLYAPQRPEW